MQDHLAMIFHPAPLFVNLSPTGDLQMVLLIVVALILIPLFRIIFLSSTPSAAGTSKNVGFWSSQERVVATELPLPPGPRPWPLVGNLLQTSPIPHEKMLEMNKKYGPLVFLRLGRVSAIVTDDPAMVKAILKNQDAVFASRPANIAAQYFTFGGKDIAFAPNGAHWRAMRRICTMELLAPKRLQDFKQGREEELWLMVQAIYEGCRRNKPAQQELAQQFGYSGGGLSEQKSSGVAMVRLREVFGSLASNNLSRMLLGKRFFGPGESGPREGQEHRAMIYDAFALVNAFNVGDYLPFLRWFDLQGHERRMKQLMQKTNSLYDAVIEEHRRKKTKTSSNSPDSSAESSTENFVDVLLAQEGLSHTVIKAILIDMAAAGTDTTSITSEWAMAELVRHPRVMARVRHEIQTVVGGNHRLVSESDLRHLTYLRAVIKEVLRIHPVGAFLIPHVSTEDTILAGYFIPKNTRALINTFSLGRNPAVWEEPLQFNPDRFLQADSTSTNLDSLFDPEYRMVPFGAGRRGCPGAALGTSMILLGVSNLVHAFDWSTVNGGEVDTSLAYNSVVLDKPLCLVASPRLLEHAYRS